MCTHCLEYCLEFIAKHELVSPPAGCHGQLRRLDHYSGTWFLYRWLGGSCAAAVSQLKGPHSMQAQLQHHTNPALKNGIPLAPGD